MNNLSKLAEIMTEKHYEEVDTLTKKQFEDALIGAIKSGDFVNCISAGASGLAQGMIYIPYREKAQLLAENSSMNRMLRCPYIHERSFNVSGTCQKCGWVESDWLSGG